MVQRPATAPTHQRSSEVEPREASGLTTRLILAYVESEGGRDAVDDLLGRAGLADREEELRDEHCWFADSVRTRLFSAAAEVFDDPDIARRIGEEAMELNVGHAFKLAMRALGSPRLIYSNVARGNAKFTLVHKMDLVALGDRHARIRNVPLAPARWHPATCPYNIGLLSSAPRLFGRPPARVRHTTCIGTGAQECIYEVDWGGPDAGAVAAAGWSAAGLGGLAAAALLLPAALPFAAAGATAAAALAGRRVYAIRRRRWSMLEQAARTEAGDAGRLTASLQDLVSDLDLDQVLAKVTRNAQVAVGGTEFALLVEEEQKGTLHCRSSSGLPPSAVAALERWASAASGLSGAPAVLDDLATVAELETLPTDRRLPLRSLCAAPLTFQDRSLGVLIALAGAPSGFLPRDVELLRSYAAQAAIALSNARLYAKQEARASRDHLTGLLNHREFHETVARELERCRRYGGRMTVAVFDLDDFKLVNDTRGHAEGDRVLQAFAEALAEACRATDLAFRIGGDEFALVLPEVGAAAADAAAARVTKQIAGAEHRVQVSFGAASWPDAGPSKDAFLASADDNLYAGKRASARQAGADLPPGETRREWARLSASSRLAAKLAPLLDPAEIARTAAQELDATLSPFFVVVHRLDDDAHLRPIAGAGALVDQLDDLFAWEMPIGRGINGRAARTGEPVLVGDTRRDPDFVVAEGVEETRSELAVPIRVAGEVWGVLDLEERAPYAFGPDDVLFADAIAATIGAAIHRSRLFEELEGAFMGTLAVLSDALEAKDPYTAAHARDVADLSERVGAALGMAADELRTLRYGALLHDVGKIGVRTEILRKPGPLSGDEFEEIKRHTVIGAQMLERIPFFAAVHPLVRSAHERWDGSGYPDGLDGEAIPLAARIICACDALHAMTSDRPYGRALPHAAALAELRANAGTQFDPQVVDALLTAEGKPLARTLHLVR